MKKENDTQGLKGDDEETTTCSQKWKRYPKHVGFIIGNEACERFSYYGMRTVLLLYLRNFLEWDNDTSTAIYHAFTVFAYFMPVFGAIIADQYWGKYKTILWLSVVYVLGHAIKTVASIPYIPSDIAHKVLAMTGLFLIAVGTGGIKPCVSAFGADQFSPDQVVQQRQFFSFFYIAINAGSLVSTFLTPIFRADVECYPGESGPKYDECYALAFGVPGALMLVALILFLLGTKWYTRYPPEGSLLPRVVKCISSAISNKMSTPSSERKKEHWLDYSSETHIMIRDTKYLLRILVLYIPLPFFWALFDQQGSRWTIQVIGMDMYLGDTLILPDQVQLINPFLILVLVPFFVFVVYPLVNKCFNFNALRKMTFGLFLTGVAFIICAIVQQEQERNMTPLPSESQHGFRFINSGYCATKVNLGNGQMEVLPQSASDIIFVDAGATEAEPLHIPYTDCNGTYQDLTFHDMHPEETTDIVVLPDSQSIMFHMDTEKTEDCKAKLSCINTLERNITFTINGDEYELGAESRTEAAKLTKGMVEVAVIQKYGDPYSIDVEVACGGIYTVVFAEEEDSTFTAWQILDVNPNVVSVGWIIPQYVVITCAEILVSITGLEFSYSQAPPAMKSVISAVWLLTVSIGNVIVLIIAEARIFEDQSNEFFLFAGLVIAAGVLFGFLAYRYVLVDEMEFAEEILEEQEKARVKALLYKRKKEAKKSGKSISDIELENDFETPVKM